MRLDHEQDGFLGQRADLGFTFLLDARDLLQVLLDHGLDLTLPPANRGPFLLREGFVLLLAQGLSTLAQGEGVDPDRRALDGEPQFAGLRLHGLEELRAFLRIALVDLLAAGLELVRLKDLGDLSAQAPDQMLHVLVKLTAHASGQLQVARAVRVVEVVGVAEVRGLGGCPGSAG